MVDVLPTPQVGGDGRLQSEEWTAADPSRGRGHTGAFSPVRVGVSTKVGISRPLPRDPVARGATTVDTRLHRRPFAPYTRKINLTVGRPPGPSGIRSVVSMCLSSLSVVWYARLMTLSSGSQVYTILVCTPIGGFDGPYVTSPFLV